MLFKSLRMKTNVSNSPSPFPSPSGRGEPYRHVYENRNSLTRFINMTYLSQLLFAIGFVFICSRGFAEERMELWVDLYAGEPTSFEEIIEDLAGVDVVFLGEAHRLKRHHDFQRDIVAALSAKGKKVLLGIEMMESEYQDALDEYNSGAIDFDELAKKTNWHENWKNFEDYRIVLEAAKAHQGKVVALNANAGIIRSIGRNGLDNIEQKDRETLPAEMNFDDPLYEKWLNQLLLVHMPFSEEMLWKVYQAQVARDETMAHHMAEAWKALDNPDEWIGVVLCGSGHCSYGNGTPSRLLRRLPDLKDRIVLMSDSGDTELTEQEKEMTREIEITHEDLRFMQRPIADYLHVIEEKMED